MQTFLPYTDFTESAKVLDKKRCWKQVVEAHQIINCLESGLIIGWKNHPAVKMWEGHTDVLKAYFNIFLYVCIHKYSINTKYSFISNMNTFTATHVLPWWLGNKNFHRAMRARLIEKDREFYLPLFPNDEGYNDGKYWWPVMETKNF
ncbi:MAG: MSMEG_6728 family protein [Candidatus Paceibacterota bacterium]|jgi:hypothetical protein